MTNAAFGKKTLAIAVMASLCAALIAVPAYGFYHVHDDGVSDGSQGLGAYEVFMVVDETAVGGDVHSDLMFVPAGSTADVVLDEGIISSESQAGLDAMNAALIAMEWNSLLPPWETPAHTEGYEGFFHLEHMEGDVNEALLDILVRDHDRAKFEEKKALMERSAAQVGAAHPTARVELTLKDSYYNMKEKLTDCMHLVDNAKRAAELAGLIPAVEPIRGGTDGARLSYMGLPCPNLGTGGYNFHGPQELACVEEMDAVVEVLRHIVELYSK